MVSVLDISWVVVYHHLKDVSRGTVGGERADDPLANALPVCRPLLKIRPKSVMDGDQVTPGHVPCPLYKRRLLQRIGTRSLSGRFETGWWS